jgi:two-component system OmpR family response regulator
MSEVSEKHILIADDDPVVRHLLSSALKAAGFQTTTVESGTACLDCFLPGQAKQYALLFLDIQLIDMSGYDVLDSLKQGDLTKGLPVILLSAHSRDEVLKSCDKAKLADGFLSKPFTMEGAVSLTQSLTNGD